MINIVGDMFGTFNIYVDFDNFRLCPPTIATALDVCFKSYYAFNIDFPEACAPVYQFMNYHFYKLNEALCDTTASSIHRSVRLLSEMAQGI